MPQRLSIFISSPSDVNAERRRAALVIEKLAKDYARFFEIDFVLWETEPMLASGHFQDAIMPPSQTDIMVLIVWSRLGTPLPMRTKMREYRGIEGDPVTGTEWEFEDALQAFERRGAPSILAYRKTIPPKAEYNSPADLAELGRQLQSLKAFCSKYFEKGARATVAFKDLDAFETKLEGDLRSLIERRIGEIKQRSDAAPGAIWLKGSPFRGLETYQIEHAPIFFGRSIVVRKAVELLVENAERGKPFLLVLGASGAGKSSLAQAGVVPALITRGVVSSVGEWRHAVMRPGGHSDGPFAALAAALGAPEALPELLAQQDVAAFARHLMVAAADPTFPILSALNAREKEGQASGRILSYEKVNLVLVMDQLEELLTIGEITPDQRRAFVLCLQGLLQCGRIFVLATMRSDYWHRTAELPLLVALSEGYGRLDLLRASQGEIAEMIRRPAEAAGLAFETDPRTEIRLDAALAEEAALEPGALPLLSFLLDALYARDVEEPARAAEPCGGVARKENRGSLTYASMHELGGLKGAIAQRAEAAIARLPADVAAALPKVLRALVTVSRAGAEPTAREAPMSRFQDGSPERKIVEALLAPDMRLLVAEGDGERALVRVAHEALITHWERAKLQIAQDRDDLRTRTVVEEGEAEWQAADSRHKRGLLLRNPQLANAIDLVERWGDELSPELRAFIALSENAAKAATRRRWAIAAVVMLCLTALSAASIWAFSIAEVQRNRVLVAQSRFLAGAARTATDAGNATLGTLLALAALPQNLAAPDRPYVRSAEFALEHAFANRRERLVLRGHADALTAAAFSPDGARLLTASSDATARVWDVRTGALLAVLHGHDRLVTAAAFSPDGTRIITASNDKTARLWDAGSGAVIAILRGHERDIRTAAFSPDSARVLTASWDGSARVWNAKTGEVVAVLRGESKSLNAAAFSPDGKRCVTSSDQKLAEIWDLESFTRLAVLRGHAGPVTAASFSPDGSMVVTASFDRTARLWDARTGDELGALRGHEDKVNAAAFSPDGARIATASDDKTVRLWDASKRTLIAVLRGHDEGILKLAFSAAGRLLATASDDDTARLWDANTGHLVSVLRGHTKDVTAVVFSADGTTVATASSDDTARLWDVNATAEIALLGGHEKEVVWAEFSPDGKRLATASNDATARIWDARSGAGLAILHGHDKEVVSVAFSPDGRRIVTASWDKTVRLWDADAGKETAVLRGHTDLVTSAEFSGDGLRIVTASYDQTARLWNAMTGQEIATLRGHPNRVNSADFSPDGTRIVTTSDDKTARLWDGKTGAEIVVLRGHEDAVKSAAFSRDSMRVVTVSTDKTARVWDVKTGSAVVVLRGHADVVTDAAFSPGGKQIVTSSWDKTGRIWDAQSGELLAELRGHDLQVASAAYSPDGSRIVTASWDGTVRLWDARTGAQIAVLRGHQHSVTAAGFSPDGTRLFSVSDDKTARVWAPPPRCRTLLDAARKELPRDLSEDERDKYFLVERSTDVSLALYGAIRPFVAWFSPYSENAC